MEKGKISWLLAAVALYALSRRAKGEAGDGDSGGDGSDKPVPGFGGMVFGATILKCTGDKPYVVELGQGLSGHVHRAANQNSSGEIPLTPDELKAKLSSSTWSPVSIPAMPIAWDYPPVPAGAEMGWHRHRLELTKSQAQQLYNTGELVTKTSVAEVGWGEPYQGNEATHPHTHPVRIRCTKG